MISREVALDWAEYVGIEARALADAEVIDQLEALINRAYAEGQKGMRERALDYMRRYLAENEEQFNRAVQALESK